MWALRTGDAFRSATIGGLRRAGSETPSEAFNEPEFGDWGMHHCRFREENALTLGLPT
jgi:hypothetical protein